MYLKLLCRILVCLLLLFSVGCLQDVSKNSLENGKFSLDKFFSYYKKITEHYNFLVEASPQNQNLKIKLAQFYYKLKDYQKVQDLLEEVDIPRAKVILAKSLVKMKSYDQAIEIFENIGSSSEDPEYVYLYGEVLQEKNLFPQAIEIYGQVKEPLKTKAQSRIKQIKSRIEVGMPQEVSQIFNDAQSFLKEEKDEAAIILMVNEKSEITKQNTSVSTIHVIEKVLKERGKNLAEVEITYDSTYERVELEFARTITESGQVIYAGEENIRDVSRYLNFPLYSNSKSFIISMPSVDVGSFIEYKVHIYSSKLVSKDNISSIYRLKAKYPIFKADFQIIIPEKKQLRFKFFNQQYANSIDLNPSITKDKNRLVYSWSFKEIKPIIPEYGMPPFSLINPAILVSSFSSWDEIYQWWFSLYEDKINLNEEAKDFVEKLTEGNDGLDKAKKIYEYVAKNIRYVAIEYGDSGYEPHHAQEVFTNRYGDCKDQAILLVAMLKSAGFSAYPVLIPTRRVYSIDKEFPSLNFNHAISALQWNDDLIFMDPTAETTPFKRLPLSDQQRQVLVFTDNSWRIANTGVFSGNQVYYQMGIKINQEEDAEINRKVKSKGFFASGWRWYLKYTHPAKIEEDIRDKMMNISSLSRFLNYKIDNADDLDLDPELSYAFVTEGFLNPAGNMRIVPVLDEMNLDYGLISKEKRDYPIDFEGIYSEQAKVEIFLPDNFEVEYLPSSQILENDWFRLEVSYKNNQGSVTFQQEFDVKQRFVAEKDYLQFKKYFKEAIYLLREEIILKK